MDRISHKVGDTVTIKVSVDNLSDNYSDVELSLYRRNSNVGFVGLIKKVSPTSVNENGEFTFVYNTDDFMNARTTYYGHFKINNNGIILNNYYKIRAIY